MADDQDHGPLTKVTVNLVPRAMAAMAQAASDCGDTATDTVTRALQAYAILVEAATTAGPSVSTFEVRGDGGPTATVVVTPAVVTSSERKGAGGG